MIHWPIFHSPTILFGPSAFNLSFVKHHKRILLPLRWTFSFFTLFFFYFSLKKYNIFVMLSQIKKNKMKEILSFCFSLRFLIIHWISSVDKNLNVLITIFLVNFAENTWYHLLFKLPNIQRKLIFQETPTNFFTAWVPCPLFVWP